MEIFNTAFLCLVCVFAISALPTQPEEAAPLETELSSYASEASLLIATNLLKSNIDIDGNQVHSPLGVASILAVLAEGAAGDTYAEFAQVFGYPKERSDLRASFKRILGKYHNLQYTAEPSFKTWLYIYRNNSACEEFRRVVRDNYFVEVKELTRSDFDLSDPSAEVALSAEAAAAAVASNSKDVVGFDTLKRLDLDEDATHLTAAVAEQAADTYGEEQPNKEASKFDRVVDDKQYVEKPVILEEIAQEAAAKRPEEIDETKGAAPAETLLETAEKLEKPEEEKPAAEKMLEAAVAEVEAEAEAKAETVAGSVAVVDAEKPAELSAAAAAESAPLKEMSKREEGANLEDNETVQADEKLQKSFGEKADAADNLIVPIRELLASNEPEKVSIPLQKLENAIEAAVKGDGEIMLALESHIRAVRRVYGARSLFNKDDITTALSANSITGREEGSKSKMLLFNGLYFHGNWAYPFFEESVAEEFFFMTADDAIKAPMMHAKGKYRVAEIEHLSAKALCIPYENKKYAMVIIMPNEVEGLHGVLEKLQPSDLKYAHKHSVEKELHISLPKFQVEETSRSEAMLKGMGLQKIFSRTEADLSLLSDDPDLHVDEIVQFVSVRVDKAGSSSSALSASTAEVRTSTAELETFDVNRPFLYFVVDCEEAFVIASGKVYTPEYKEELPITIDVEFEQA